MEEARLHLPISRHQRGNPRGVAARRGISRQTQVGAEVLRDACEVRGTIDNKGIRGHCFQLAIERREVRRGQGNFVLPEDGPRLGAIEGGGGEVGCQVGNGREPERLRRSRSFRECAVVAALDDSSRCDGEFRAYRMDRGNTPRDAIEAAGRVPDSIVQLGRTIQGHDGAVHMFGDLRCVSFEEQTCGKDAYLDSTRSQWLAQCEEIGVHQRLASGEHHPAGAELFQRRQPRAQFPELQPALHAPVRR